MWTYEGKEVDGDLVEGYTGFVYRITNTVNGRKYIGKKLFKSTRTKKVKGKTRRKKTVIESNWKQYYGSNAELLEDVEKYGETSFKREIIALCKTKGTANYLEMKYQILENALESPQYYNQWIAVKVHKSQIKLQKQNENRTNWYLLCRNAWQVFSFMY